MEKTLRDEFAMAALTGFCANNKALKENLEEYKRMIAETMEESPDILRGQLALTCYQFADAMLKVRAESNQ